MVVAEAPTLARLSLHSGHLRGGGLLVSEPESGSTVGKRVAELRVAYGLSQAELARRAGVGQGLIGRIERGFTASPRGETLRLLADVLHVTVNDLLSPSAPESANTAQLPELPISSWVHQISVGPMTYVPQVSITLSAGDPQYTPDGEPWLVPMEWARGKQLVAAKVDGTCMEPELMDGDTVIVDVSRREPSQGDIIVALLEDGTMAVKRFNTFQGVPMLVDNRNRLYPLDNAQVQGIVVSAHRRYQ